MNRPGNPRWQKCGQTKHGQRYALKSDYHDGKKWHDWLCTELGSIKPKNDGRWEWFRSPNTNRPDWHVTKHEQGVCKTMQEARRKVEEGFYEDAQPARAG